MRILILFAWLLSFSSVLAQEQPLVLHGGLPVAQMDIAQYTSFYEDISGDTLPLSVIRTNTFIPFVEMRYERDIFPDRPMRVIWLHVALHNTHPTDTLRLLYQTGSHGLISLYEIDHMVSQTGMSLPHSPQPNLFTLPLIVPPNNERSYWIRVIDYIYSPIPISSKLLTEPGSAQIYFDVLYIPEHILLAALCILVGCLLFMGLSTLYSFVLIRDRAFLYYALYALVCVLFTVQNIDYRFRFFWLFPPRISDALFPFHPSIISFFYTLFIIEVLNVRQQFPGAWKIVKGLLVILVLQEVLAVVEWSYARPLFMNMAIYKYTLIPSGLITCVLLIAIIRSRSPIRHYLLAGILSLLVLLFLFWVLNIDYVGNLSPVADDFVNYPYLFLILGVSVEALCFALALAYRGRLTELENRRIQERYTHDLKLELAQRSQEIAIQCSALEQQHIRQLETEFEKKLADTEMIALRAQMNPHFIFNCLNSIKLYTLENDSEQASEYLTKFARLIRLVLENSRSELVTLRNELEALQLYMELEAMRFKNKVQFSISVSPEVDVQYLRIPPLLLQPFVENAIWHGLMHKAEGGTVTIEVCQPEEHLLRIDITDDGVGRARAAELKSKSASKHKSLGMQVTADRIRMINQLYDIQTRIQVTDLVDSFGEPCGTRVLLEIPV